MDSVYVPHNSFCTDKIDFTSYFNDYLKETSEIPNNIPDIMKFLEPDSTPDLKELEQITSPYIFHKTEEDLLPDLNNANKEEEDSADEDVPTTRAQKRRFQYTKSNYLTMNCKQEDSPIDYQQGNEFLVTVQIYLPHAHSFMRHIANRMHKCKPSHLIVLLGSSTLADLRDKIVCPHDVGYNINVESKFSTDISPKELYPSGFIFIENTFYNDFRCSNSMDYSDVIRTWASKMGIGELRAGLMDKVQIKDISLRLGYPYVFQHQGKCEHLVVFTNARLTSPSDTYLKYPYYQKIQMLRSRSCDICKTFLARYLCLESTRLLHDQCYLCKRCFVSYNYINGKKIGHFKAYHYLDPASVV